MSAGDTGRRMAYLRWPHEELAHAMVQAENDIKELRDRLQEAIDERERFYRESRNSAQALGGILRVLRDNGIDVDCDELPDDAPNLVRLGARPRRFTRHVQIPDPGGLGRDACSCGAVYPPGEYCCVSVRDAEVAWLRAEWEERSSWSPPSFPGGDR